VRFDHPAQQIVLQDYIHAVEDAETRRDRLTRQIEELMPSWSMAPVAASLQAMRGVALVAAVTVVAEVGDFRRFTNARQLMAYLGLAPSEHSSGSTVRRAGITKAGNALARRVLIEGAWTYRMSARVSRKLRDRLEPLSAAIRDIAWKAQVRLCARYRRLAAIVGRAITLGAGKAYDAEDLVNELRSMTVTPHVAQNTSDRSSAIDARTKGSCAWAFRRLFSAAWQLGAQPKCVTNTACTNSRNEE
jgi:hypothetical protein